MTISTQRKIILHIRRATNAAYMHLKTQHQNTERVHQKVKFLLHENKIQTLYLRTSYYTPVYLQKRSYSCVSVQLHKITSITHDLFARNASNLKKIVSTDQKTIRICEYENVKVHPCTCTWIFFYEQNQFIYITQYKLTCTCNSLSKLHLFT